MIPGARLGLAGLLLVAGVALAQTPPFELQDSSGRPVAGARIVLSGAPALIQTDAQGRFRLDPEPAPPFEIAVFDARGAWLGKVLVTETATRVLRLAPATEEEVTVRSAVSVETQASPAAAVTVVTSREIQESRPSQLADALRLVPGATSSGEGHSSVPSLRGMARGRTLILLDGGRVTAERRAGASATFLDPAALDSIEIVRGPGSVAYGSDALGGIISASTPSPDPSGFSGRVSLAWRTVDDSLAGGASLNVPLGRGAVRVAGHWRKFGDYDSPRGRIEDSEAEFFGFSARSLVPIGQARLSLGAQIDRGRDVGKPAKDSNVIRTVYPLEDSNRFTLGFDLPGGAGFSDVELRAFFGSYRLVTDRERQPAPGVSRQLARADVDANDAGLRAVGTRPLGTGMLRVGIDANGRFNLRAIGLTVDAAAAQNGRIREVSIDRAERFDVGAFVEADQSVLSGALRLGAGVRGDWVRSENFGGYFGDRSLTRGSVSGFASATVTPASAWNVTLQYAHGFRDPTLSDRYFRGVSGRGFVTGNPDLEPESSNHLDLAVRADVGSSLHLAAYGYLFRIRDLIERYQQGADFFFRNRGEGRFKGIELEADLDVAPGWSLRLAGNAASGRIVDDDSPAADVPPESLSLAIQNRPTERLWWSLRARAVARDGDPGPTETATPGYGTLDLLAGWQLLPGVEAQALLTNLADHAYPEGPDAAAVLASGRSFSLVLSGRF